MLILNEHAMEAKAKDLEKAMNDLMECTYGSSFNSLSGMTDKELKMLSCSLLVMEHAMDLMKMQAECMDEMSTILKIVKEKL